MNDLESAIKLIDATNAAYRNKQALPFAGILREGNEIIGTCGFTNIEVQNAHAEIGGEMATQFWGKGIAQEAVNAILDYGINTIGFKTIEAKVSPENRGAVFILEQLGFKKEAHFHNRIYYKERWQDMAVFTLHN